MIIYYEELFRELNKNKVQYVVYGGLAAILHGVHRTTGDVDIIILLEASNIERFFALMQKLKYRPKLPVKLEDFKDKKKRQEWFTKKNMRVFSFFHKEDPFKWVDLCVDPKIEFEKVKKQFTKIGQLKIPLITIEELIKFKKKAGRPVDLLDINDLDRLRKLNNA